MKHLLASHFAALAATAGFAFALATRPASAESVPSAPSVPVERTAKAAVADPSDHPAEPPEISFAVQKVTESPSEGPDIERSYFLVGSKRVALSVPKGCRLLVGDGFTLRPVDGSDGEIHVTSSPFTAGVNFFSEAVRYHDAAARGVPQGAEGENPVAPAMDLFPFNGWKSMGFTWNYAVYGRSVVRNVSFINVDLGVQVMVTTEASKTNAPNIEKLAKQFLSSWYVMQGS